MTLLYGTLPDKAIWTAKATALRAAAAREPDPVAQQTLLRLAEDCGAIAGEIEAQQPGKPKPPGNPPQRPDPDQPQPIGEPPRPVPPPRPEPPPAPVQTRRGS
jgi:outer membrane biosynthesis protein TonB